MAYRPIRTKIIDSKEYHVHKTPVGMPQPDLRVSAYAASRNVDSAEDDNRWHLPIPRDSYTTLWATARGQSISLSGDIEDLSCVLTPLRLRSEA